ncbi:Gfo/Idh/MocA family protein [[Eubacterium] cellulosolvens]
MTAVAVVGTGYWGRNHVRVFKELMDEGKISDLILCDVSEERVKALAQGFNLDYTTNYDEILADKAFDSVSIVTPSREHYDMAKKAIENGKNVLVEKPMTMTSAEAEKLVKFTEERDGILMVGHIFRHHSAAQELKKRVARGDFGRIMYMYCNRQAFRVPRKDMGVLHALGIHEMDLFCYLLNQDYPEGIYTHMEQHFFPNIEETALIILSFAGNITCYAFESWMAPVAGKKRELIVIGDKMSSRIDYLKPQELQIFDSAILPKKVDDSTVASGDGQPDYELEQEGSYTIPIEYREPLKEELKHFISCATDHTQPLSDMYSGKRAVEMIEVALKSAETKSLVKLKDMNY